MNNHRGEIVEKIVRESGYPLSILAKRLYISRNTLYKRFKIRNLSYEFILAVGHVIGYDFSTVFPVLEDMTTALQNKIWDAKDEYITLLERYTDLVILTAKTLASTDIPHVREEIAEFVRTSVYRKLTGV